MVSELGVIVELTIPPAQSLGRLHPNRDLIIGIAKCEGVMVPLLSSSGIAQLSVLMAA